MATTFTMLSGLPGRAEMAPIGHISRVRVNYRCRGHDKPKIPISDRNVASLPTTMNGWPLLATVLGSGNGRFVGGSGRFDWRRLNRRLPTTSSRSAFSVRTSTTARSGRWPPDFSGARKAQPGVSPAPALPRWSYTSAEGGSSLVGLAGARQRSALAIARSASGLITA